METASSSAWGPMFFRYKDWRGWALQCDIILKTKTLGCEVKEFFNQSLTPYFCQKNEGIVLLYQVTTYASKEHL